MSLFLVVRPDLLIFTLVLFPPRLCFRLEVLFFYFFCVSWKKCLFSAQLQVTCWLVRCLFWSRWPGHRPVIWTRQLPSGEDSPVSHLEPSVCLVSERFDPTPAADTFTGPDFGFSLHTRKRADLKMWSEPPGIHQWSRSHELNKICDADSMLFLPPP